MLRHFRAGDTQIEHHIHGITGKIAALNPILIYLSHPSVRVQQVWISSIRSKPHLAEEQYIRFMENRKRIELMLLDKLPFPTYTIENVNLDWEDVFNGMVGAIGGSWHVATYVIFCRILLQAGTTGRDRTYHERVSINPTSRFVQVVVSAMNRQSHHSAYVVELTSVC